MYELDRATGEPRRNSDGTFKAGTSHALGPVPGIFYENQSEGLLTVSRKQEFGLSNLAATTVKRLGYETLELWKEGILEFECGAVDRRVR